MKVTLVISIILVFILIFNKYYSKKMANMPEEKRQEIKEAMEKSDAWMKKALIVLLLFIVALIIFNNMDSFH